MSLGRFSWMRYGSAMVFGLTAALGLDFYVRPIFHYIDWQTSVRDLKINKYFGCLPLYFERNHGQANPEAKFVSRGCGYSLLITPQETVLVFENSLSSRSSACKSTDILRLEAIGTSSKAILEGAERLPGFSNYFIGNKPSKWHTKIPQYAKVKARGLYKGVDMVYYGKQRCLEYDYIVAPGIDPGIIRFKVKGKGIRIEPCGDLTARLDKGEVVIKAPIAYQQYGANKKRVECGYVLNEAWEICFKVGDYDRRRVLVIDPQIDYSTYLGGSGEDYGWGIAVDSSGNAYVTGYTGSSGFPATSGSFQTASNSGNEVFVAKLNPTGTALLYSTYLGGNGDDYSFGIAVDGSGSAYITGHTYSADFPTTSGVFQTIYGGASDAFAAKLDPTGAALVYSTYLGGSSDDYGWGIELDGGGNAYVAGSANSANFPTTGGAFQTTTGGAFDVFLTKLNTNGTGLIYSTYLGGNSNEQGNGIVVDGGGNAYVTGYTASTNFPTTGGSFRVSPIGGNDVFITQFNSSGTALVYSTYLGGSNDDMGAGIALDLGGNAYVIGSSFSTNFSTTVGAFQTVGGGSFSDAFVTKLNSSGAALVYSTYLGGNATDYGWGIEIDGGGNAYLTGSTASTNFPITPWAFQPIFGGMDDTFVTKLNSTGSALVYSTFLGGSGTEQGSGIVFDPSGNAYVCGFSSSADFPTTAGVLQAANAGLDDAFATKFDVSAFDTPTSTCTFTATSTETATSTPTPTATNTATSSLTQTITPTPSASVVSSPGTTQTVTPTSPEHCFYISLNTFIPAQGPLSIYVAYPYYPGNYQLLVFNTAGENINIFDNREINGPVKQSYAWDGTNKYGEKCASGVYIFHLITPFDREMKRVLLIR